MRIALLSSLSLLVTNIAYANYSCVGTVLTSTSRADVLVAEFSYAPSSSTYICSMSSTAPNGVTAEQCRNVYAMLLAAQVSGKRVEMWYSDTLSCSTQPTWSWVVGWYHGPRLLD